MVVTLPETLAQKQTIPRAFDQELNRLVTQKTFNPGVNTSREFEFRSVVYKAPAVKVMDRKPFFEVSDSKGVNDYYIMDVVNLRQADMAVNYRGVKSADLLLNHLSQIVVNRISNFNSQNEGKQVFFCRYGGDEFGFSYTGMTPQEIEAFNLQIKGLLGKMYAFYRPNLNSELIVKGNINVEFKDHSRPKDDLGRVIFDHFKENAVLLNEEEINKLKEKFDNDYVKFRLWRVLQEQSSFYPLGVVGLEDRLNYLANVNPLMRDEIAKLRITADNSGSGEEAARFKLVRALEKLFEDPLLKRPVISGAELIANIKAGNISHVWTKDIKFMKQLNDVSYADGDSAIETLWKRIDGCIEPGDMGKLVVARNGGTILLGLREGEKLSSRTVTNLKALDSVNYKGIASNQQVTLAIGNHDHEVNPELRREKYGLRKDLPSDLELRVIKLMSEENNQTFNKSDEKFFMDLALKLLLPDGMIGDKVTRTYWDTVFDKNAQVVEGLFTPNIIRNYFISKRASQHLTKLEMALDKMDVKRVISRYLTTGGKEVIALEAFTDKHMAIRKRVREAMNYAYSHPMTEKEDLDAIRLILCG